MPKILLLLFLALSLTACVSDKVFVNTINLKHIGTKVIFTHFSNDNMNYFDPIDSIKTIAYHDTVFGININTAKVTKVAFNKLIDFPRPKGYFHFLQDSLLLYTSALVDFTVQDNHNRMLRMYNLKTNTIRFFQFTGLPVIFKDPISGEMKNTLKDNCELNFSKWTYKLNAKDTSLYVLIKKSLTSEEVLKYTSSDNMLIVKVYLNKLTKEIFPVLFPRFSSFGKIDHIDIRNPYNCFDDRGNIMLGYPAHLDLYQYDITAKTTKVIPVASELLPNEIPIDTNNSINIHNTSYIQMLRNTGGNGYFRSALTSAKPIVGDYYKNYLDDRTVLVWQKDDGSTSEAILDKSIWSVAYVQKDTLYCNTKILPTDTTLRLEKYLITGTTKVPKDVYMNRIKAAVLKEKGKK